MVAAARCHGADGAQGNPKFACRHTAEAASAPTASASSAVAAGEQHVALIPLIDPAIFLVVTQMKSSRTNHPILILAAVVLVAAPFVGLAWRTHEWLGW